MPVIAFSPAIGPVSLDCWISENHRSEMEIAAAPLETGAEVSDHANVMPKSVVLDVADAGAAETYRRLIELQEAREPFTLVTGLRVYPDMLIRSIDTTRDRDTPRILSATVDCREVVIVGTATVPARIAGDKPVSAPGRPGGTNSTTAAPPTAEITTDDETRDRVAAPVQRGDAPTETVPEKETRSLLKSIFGGLAAGSIAT